MTSYRIQKEIQKKEDLQLSIRKSLNRSILGEGVFPDIVYANEKSYTISYTFNHELNDYIKKLLKTYRSDFSSVVVIDNETGSIISAVGYRRDYDKFDYSLVFSNTHPTASIFKIVTSAELLENAGVGRNSSFSYVGRPTTLYRSQLKDSPNKWAKAQTLEKAFAISNNVVFARAALKKLTGKSISNMANQLGFNERLMSELDLVPSKFLAPETSYNLAEIASGFNTTTTMGTIHGATIASVIANAGILKYPKIVSEIIDNEDGAKVLLFDKDSKRSLDEMTAKELSMMMEKTIIEGTAKSSFRKLSLNLRNFLSIGGKTGSITGGIPYGKRDWFTVYARPKNEVYGKGISICVMNINVNKWYVKSTFLAKSIIEYYYNRHGPTLVNTSFDNK